MTSDEPTALGASEPLSSPGRLPAPGLGARDEVLAAPQFGDDWLELAREAPERPPQIPVHDDVGAVPDQLRGGVLHGASVEAAVVAWEPF
jgi:hypothetical protein